MTFVEELSALFRRDLLRVVQELEAFENESALWAHPQGISNSAGNLALHLEGNLREYIGRQLGHHAYQRTRDLEFSSRDIPCAELTRRLREVSELVPSVLTTLAEAVLDAPYPDNVLGKPLSARQFLLHLLAHLNYHLGQMDYVRRMLTGKSAIPLATL